jgi:hypothetical protein
MEAGEFGRVRDLAIAASLAEGHVSRQLRLAYLAPEVLKRLVYGREGPAVTVLDLSDCAALPWAEQAGVVFEGDCQSARKTDPLVGLQQVPDSLRGFPQAVLSKTGTKDSPGKV